MAGVYLVNVLDVARSLGINPIGSGSTRSCSASGFTQRGDPVAMRAVVMVAIAERGTK